MRGEDWHSAHYVDGGVQSTLVPQSAASTTWLNPTYALVDDGSKSTITGGTNSWLRLTNCTNRSLPPTAEIVGIMIRVKGSFTTPTIFDPYHRLQVALTVDGSSNAGTIDQIDLDTGIPAGDGYYEVGGIGSLWGRTWTVAEIGGSTFGGLIRRGDVLGMEDIGSERDVDAATLIVYFNEGESLTMAERLYGAQRYVFAPEVTPGTPVTPTIMLKHSGLDLYTKPEYTQVETFGQMLPADRFMAYASSSGPLKVSAVDYNELAFWLASRFGKPTATNLATGVYRLEYDIDPRKLITKWTMTCQFGDFGIGEQYAYTVLQQFGLSFSKKTVSMSGQGIAQAGTDLRNGGDTTSKGIMGGINAVQTLTQTGTPAGGTFKLRYKGAETTALAYNLTGATMTTALEALTTIGAGNVVVTGAASGPWVATFQGALAGMEVLLIELSLNSLTGGTAPTVTPVMTTKGGWTEYATAPVVPGKSSVYMHTALATLAANKVTELKEFGFESADYVDPDDTFDNTNLTFSSLVEKPSTLSVNLGVQADAKAQDMRKTTRSQVSQYCRVENISDQIVGSAIPYSLTMDMFGKLQDAGEITAMGQKVGNKFTFNVFYDPTWGASAKLVLVCAVPGTAF